MLIRDRVHLAAYVIALLLSLTTLALLPAIATAKPSSTRCFGHRATIVVTKATGRGTPGNDVIVVARPRGARVDGKGGNDLICGGKGNDVLKGGRGRDQIKGGKGRDFLNSGPGRHDRLIGGKGLDRFVANNSTKTDLKLGEFLNGEPKLSSSKLRKKTVVIPPKQIVKVSAGGNDTTKLTLKKTAPRLHTGQPVVVDVSPVAPKGALGTVSAVKRRNNKRFVSLKPASLDEAYSKFKIKLQGATLGELTSSGKGTVSASSAKPGAAHASSLLGCSGSGPAPRLNVDHDFSKLKPAFDFDLSRPEIFFLLSGSPKLTVDLANAASASCSYNGGPTFRVFLGGPVVLTIKPAMTASVSGAFGVKFNWQPRLAIGVQKGPGVDNHFNVFNAGTTDASFYGTGNASLFLGASVGVSVGERVGVEGKAGPKVEGHANVNGSTACFDASGSLHAGLKAYADVFVSRWEFNIAEGDFGKTPFAHSCVPVTTVPPPPAPETSKERARISWDTNNTDVDLHIWDQFGNHAWYGEQDGIPGATLSVDITTGFGPEVFYDEESSRNRTFTYGLCYFDDHGEGETFVETEIIDPNGTTRSYGDWLWESKENILLGSSPPGFSFIPEEEWC